MNKEEKVRIDLSARIGSQNPPIMFKRSRRQAPSQSRFALVPKFNPTLREATEYVQWNAVEKKIQIGIRETYDFSTFDWIQSIEDRRKEAQKGPFVDMEKDAVFLYFLDDEGHEVAVMKFKNLKLVEHTCGLSKGPEEKTFGANLDPTPLLHNIELLYEEGEKVVFDDEERPLIPNNEVSDEEWNTRQDPS